MILAVAEFIGGSLALRATLIHSADYANGVQWWAEIAVSSLLCIAGLALLRGWRWAARLTGIVLYLLFFVVLVTISLAFESSRGLWWYWSLPLVLPLLGWCIHVVRGLYR